MVTESFVGTTAGKILTYGVNTNTNYNSGAEARADVSGMGRLVELLAAQLHAET